MLFRPLIIVLISMLIGLGGFAVASKISIGTPVSFPVDI